MRDKEGHYIMIKGSIQEEDITIVKYLCTQHRSTSIHKTNTKKKKTLTDIKGEIDNFPPLFAPTLFLCLRTH